MSATKIGDLQAHCVAVYKRAGFFEFDLACRAAFCLQCTLERGFGFRLYDIIGVIGLIDQYAQRIWRHLYHATANSEVIKLTVGITLSVANSNNTRSGNAHQRLVSRKYSDFTSCSRQDDLIDIFVDFGSKKGNELEIHVKLVLLLA